MKTAATSTEFEARATDALKSLFTRVSGVKLIEVEHLAQASGSPAIRARIDVHGHIHTLVCDTDVSGETGQLRAALHQMQAGSESNMAGAIPFVIAPHLSEEAQTLCKQNKMGFLDFEGNARLNIGDFFIVMRSLPRQPAARVSARPQMMPPRAGVDPILPNALPKISQKHPALALSA